MDDNLKIDPSKIIPAMVKNNINTVVVRTCGICDFPLSYELDVKERLWFDADCDCVCTMAFTGPHERDSYDVADLINMQPSKEGKLQVAAKFGLKEEDFDHG